MFNLKLINVFLFSIGLFFMVTLFPIKASAETWICEASWYFSDIQSTKSYQGIGNSESDAFSNAKSSCKELNKSSQGDQRGYVCDTNPSKLDCGVGVTGCISSTAISETGFNNSNGGHKTNWCRSQGFDTYDPANEKSRGQGDCVRKCPSSCEKVPLRSLGYSGSGSQFKFCLAKGFKGQSDPFTSRTQSGAHGYCWNDVKCSIPEPIRGKKSRHCPSVCPDSCNEALKCY